MKLNCIIIDDEQLAGKLIQTYCEKVDALEVLGTFQNPLKALEFLQKKKVDLIFLDIQMPEISGVDFFKSLIDRPMVIFTTAYDQFAVKGFELDAVDYLLKPFSFDRFLVAVQKALKKKMAFHSPSLSEGGPLKIKVRADHKVYFLLPDNILFIESQQEYVVYHMNTKKILALGSLKSLERSLPDQFCRTHKSYIVNLDKVNVVEGNMLVVGTHKIPIGNTFRTEVHKSLSL